MEDAKLGLGDVLRVRALERKEEIAAALIQAAIEHKDVAAPRLLYDRTEGKVPDRVDVVSGLSPEELAMVERSREYARLSELSDDELRVRLEMD